MLRNSRKTHCHRGHPLDGENLTIRTDREADSRACKACHRGHHRVRAGWPEDLAYSLPVQKLGYRPEGIGRLWHQSRITKKPKRADLDRFMANVDLAPGCWAWHGPKNETGYGRFYFRGRNWKAHRVAYELMVGPIPPREGYHGTIVMHTCDNPRCVNPLHLRLGSNADNLADAKAKGRLRGNNRNKLNEDDVRKIRERAEAGERLRVIAKDYGINVTHVSHIRTRKAWSCVQ